MNIKETTENRQKWIDLYKIKKGCSICGYNNHPSALCFDHLEEYKKSKAPETKNGHTKKG